MRDEAAPPVLVAGLGSAGRRHARNLLALGRTRLVLYRTGRGQAGPLEPPLDALPAEATLDAALAHDPRAAVVANPTALHVETALAAARAGCHLLLEKPVSHTLDGLDGLAREVDARGLAVVVGYQLRFHPTLRAVHAWVADGAVGRLVAAQAHWGEYLPGWHPGEDYTKGYSARAALGGGVVLTLSHPLDYLRWIAGEIEAVAGFAGRAAGLELDVEDTAVFSVRFASGALGSLTLDYAERPPRHALHLTGTGGRIAWDAATGEARLWRAGTDAVTVERPPEGFERNDLFREEMRHFLACCDGAEAPACTLADGVRAVEVALAALRAAGEGRTVRV